MEKYLQFYLDYNHTRTVTYGKYNTNRVGKNVQLRPERSSWSNNIRRQQAISKFPYVVCGKIPAILFRLQPHKDIDLRRIYNAYSSWTKCSTQTVKGLLGATTSGDNKQFLSFNLRKLIAKHARSRANINEPDNESQVLTHCNHCRAASCNCVVIMTEFRAAP